MTKLCGSNAALLSFRVDSICCLFAWHYGSYECFIDDTLIGTNPLREIEIGFIEEGLREVWCVISAIFFGFNLLSVHIWTEDSIDWAQVACTVLLLKFDSHLVAFPDYNLEGDCVAETRLQLKLSLWRGVVIYSRRDQESWLSVPQPHFYTHVRC